ncbi:M24 family metallopeptidase [Anaerovibrio slackiae]|uniref:M24 family metallopeptidase n=1 Tax=Anaerovibrio slackiae TaxID=2652309 RepID=UPI00386E4475
MYKDRLIGLREYLREQELDGVVVSKLENLHYFSGFTGDDSMLVIGMNTAQLVTDFRYVEQATREAPDFKVKKQEKGLLKRVAEVINEDGLSRVGFEGGSLCYDWHRKIAGQLHDVDFTHSVSLDSLRQVKSQEELACIRRAMEIGDEAFEYILTYIRPGISELDVAAALENCMRQKGSQRPSFDTIVASGKRGSLPHGTATEKLINVGEFVTMDYGAVYKGYHSDMTRTVCMGRADEKQRHVYSTVLKAQELGVSLVQPGASGKEVDRLVRQQIAEAGYGRYFGHGLGHSVGLEIHEEPRLSPSSTCEALAEDMLVTVEPGIYIPDWGGVRIEDTVAVREGGCEILTHSPKELIELGV